ncbi:MAG: glycosyltransferase [Candidatus Nanopelagicales bacterium]|nr:glycosyltransferase [Candidatus Nanopelagicales bacterium]MDZ4250172.1 glycosyltransferase [Candidatus Nanopelagicales bacterium]
MRVLLVAWAFPPSRASGVHRAVAIARWLAARGHSVTVLSADREFFELGTGVDAELERRLPQGVTTARVTFPMAEDPIVNRWPALRANDRRRWAADAEESSRAFFPEKHYGGWRDRLVGSAIRLHRQNSFHLTIATGNPYVSFAASLALNTHAGVPFVMDDRDSFLYWVYTGEPQPEFDRRRSWWEALASRCVAAWFVNPPIAELYRRDYPDLASRILVVENGWDPEYLDPSTLATPSSDPPIFGYVGTLNALFPLEHLLRGWRGARGRTIPADSELRVYGGLGYRHQAAPQREQLRQAAAEGVRIMGAFPRVDASNAYEQSQVLVFGCGGGSLMTASKVYEYVATGLPIAAVVPDDHDSLRILAGYPRAHIRPSADEAAWPEALASALADARSTSIAGLGAARAYGQRFRRDVMLDGPLGDAVSTASQARDSAGRPPN